MRLPNVRERTRDTGGGSRFAGMRTLRPLKIATRMNAGFADCTRTFTHSRLRSATREGFAGTTNVVDPRRMTTGFAIPDVSTVVVSTVVAVGGAVTPSPHRGPAKAPGPSGFVPSKFRPRRRRWCRRVHRGPDTWEAEDLQHDRAHGMTLRVSHLNSPHGRCDSGRCQLIISEHHALPISAPPQTTRRIAIPRHIEIVSTQARTAPARNMRHSPPDRGGPLPQEPAN